MIDDDDIPSWNGHQKSEAASIGCMAVVFILLAMIVVFGAYGAFMSYGG